MLLAQAEHTLHLTAGQQLTGYLTHFLSELLHLHPQLATRNLLNKKPGF
jgi:hypothetical protein